MDSAVPNQPNPVRDDDDIYLFHDVRLDRSIETPHWVIDRYLPLLGFDGLGLYSLYVRIATLPKHIRRRAALDEVAKAGRIGKEKRARLDAILVDLGFIKQIKPDPLRQSRHIATHTFILDPPKQPSLHAIETYGPPHYQTLDGWLFDELKPFDPESGRPGSPPVAKAGAHVDPRSESGGPVGPPLLPKNDDSGGPVGPPNVHINIVRDSEKEESSLYENPDDDVDSGASVMESYDDASFVRQVQLNLMTGAQQHGWMGAGCTWSDDYRGRILANRQSLTADRLAYAVDQWWEHKEQRERFNLVSSLPWIITTCQNYTEQSNGSQWPKRNSNSRNGRSGHDDTPAAWIRPVAELCAPGELNVYPDIIF